jgi:hypothetical protein
MIFNIILDFFKSPKQKNKEKLYNINYDIPEHINDYNNQNLTRSTLRTKSAKDYDELNKDYDKYDYTKPRITSEPPPNGLQPLVDNIQLPNGGLVDYELIRQRDLGVLANPLLPPERRVERPTIDMTLPLLKNKYIGLPTRGSYDTYQQTGYLVEDGNPNNILRLFGRQKWPGSTQYEYYATKSTVADQYKVPLYDLKREIYDNDVVKIDKLFPGTYRYVQFKQEELI